MTFSASVIKGFGRGKRLGVPTLNLDTRAAPPRLRPGIYAARVTIGEKTYHAAMHFGSKPFYKEGKSLEVHLIDVSLPSTPTSVDVEVIEKMRAIRNFQSEEELTKQMEEDISEARGILALP